MRLPAPGALSQMPTRGNTQDTPVRNNWQQSMNASTMPAQISPLQWQQMQQPGWQQSQQAPSGPGSQLGNMVMGPQQNPHFGGGGAIYNGPQLPGAGAGQPPSYSQFGSGGALPGNFNPSMISGMNQTGNAPMGPGGLQPGQPFNAQEAAGCAANQTAPNGPGGLQPIKPPPSQHFQSYGGWQHLGPGVYKNAQGKVVHSAHNPAAGQSQHHYNRGNPGRPR